MYECMYVCMLVGYIRVTWWDTCSGDLWN